MAADDPVNDKTCLQECSDDALTAGGWQAGSGHFTLLW
jgi:hypothetical protein